MKILLSNYRYFISGGPERYLFTLTGALNEQGNEVIPFSIQYQRNLSTPYSHYFVESLGGLDEVYFREQKFGVNTLWRTLSRLFYAPDVERAIKRIVKDTKPQIAYVLHYLRKLSPSLLVGLKGASLPIVVRLSDFAMLCPQAHFMRENAPCELCIKGNLFPSVKYRCVQGSLPASVINALATQFHKSMHYFELVDVFVTTTSFMFAKMIEAGYSEQRLRFIPTFVDSAVFHPASKDDNNIYFAYAGRLDSMKGVGVLIEAVAMLISKRHDIILNIQIAGSGDEQYVNHLKQEVERLNCSGTITFVGELGAEEIVDFLNQAYVSIVPSIWYENLPNSILESYACGTPVLASNLGSLPECVEEGKTGFLFEAGNASDLAEHIAFCLDHPEEINQMGHNSRKLAETIYSKEQHLEKLEALFGELLERNVSRN